MLTSLGCYQRVEGYVIVKIWWFILDLFSPTMVMWSVCSMTWLYLLFVIASSFLVWSWGVCLWDTCRNHFWVIDQLYLIVSSRFERTEMFWDDLFLIMLCCNMFWIDHFRVFDQYFDLLLGYFLVAHWEPLDIVIYHWCLQLLIENYCDYYDYHLILFSCSWRIDVIILDYLLVLSSHLYRTEVIFSFMIPWA